MRMMRHLLVILLLLWASAQAMSQPLAEIRKSFHKALLDPTHAEENYEYISVSENNDPTAIAYKAAGEALMAQAHWNPISKLSYIRRYGQLMKEAIAGDPENLEIRFLRFAVEYQLPRFLMMSDHVMEDRDFIVNHMEDVHRLSVDPVFVRYISWFMNSTGLLEPEQLTMMEKNLASLGEEGQ